MERALGEGAKQTTIFTQFTEALEMEAPARLANERIALRVWDEDPIKKDGTSCPYHIEQSRTEWLVSLSPSCANIALDLSVAEIKLQAELSLGSRSGSHASLEVEEQATLTQFLARGLKIEQDRCVNQTVMHNYVD